MAVHPDYRGQGLIKKVAKPVYAALRERGAVAGVRSKNRTSSGVVAYRHFTLTVSGRRLNQYGVSLLMADGEDLGDLLAGWVSALWQSGVRFVHVLTTPFSELKDALQKTAVCLTLPYSRHPYYLTVKPLNADYTDDLLDIKQWDCVGGDIL